MMHDDLISCVGCTMYNCMGLEKNDDSVDDENNDDSGNNGLIMVAHHWWVSLGFFFTFVFSSEPADLMIGVCSLYVTNLCSYFVFVFLCLVFLNFSLPLCIFSFTFVSQLI